MHLGYNFGGCSIFLGGTWIHRVMKSAKVWRSSFLESRNNSRTCESRISSTNVYKHVILQKSNIKKQKLPCLKGVTFFQIIIYIGIHHSFPGCNLQNLASEKWISSPGCGPPCYILHRGKLLLGGKLVTPRRTFGMGIWWNINDYQIYQWFMCSSQHAPAIKVS